MNQPTDLYVSTLQDIREDLRQVRDHIESGLSQVNGRIDRVNERIDKLMIVTWVIGGSVVAALLGSIINLIVTVLVARSG